MTLVESRAMKRLKKYVEWKEGQAAIQTPVFDRIYTYMYVFPLTVVASVKKLLTLCRSAAFRVKDTKSLLHAARTKLDCCDRQTGTRNVLND